MFYDLYTPSNHQIWSTHTTARKDWIEEPKAWIKGFADNFKLFAVQQGVDSAARRHKRQDLKDGRPRSGARGGYKKKSRSSLAN
jgi:hypothetical protein